MDNLLRDVLEAERRERNDDHLTNGERCSLVERVRNAYPNAQIPEDLTDAFLWVITELV